MSNQKLLRILKIKWQTLLLGGGIMSKQKNIVKVVAKARKNNIFPNITTAYAILSAKDTIGSDATATIEENNQKAP
jgi:hypothetical protein